MSARRCDREYELLNALRRGFIGAELHQHTDECSSCRELESVASALLNENVQAITEAAVPSAATMWWRMQMRVRQEAQARARRSLLIGQALTVMIAVALLVSLLGSNVAVEVRQLFAVVRLSTPILLAIGTWLLLAPIAGYVALRQK